MEDFEKLGVFYLGRPYDLAKKKPKPGWLLYDSKDLVTHAVCVGMTGSGKTGLCLGLLEEAAIDGIPAIVIDPKGDLANLMLTFPKLRGEDFAPWINEDDARKKGLSPGDFATQQAELWKQGLSEWGQSGERIQKLKDAAEFVVYTPGSNAGVPVSIMKSFAAPSQDILDPQHTFQVLTKRADRMASFFRNREVPTNAWLGVSVEDQKYGVPRIGGLRQVDARIRFLSVEPLLEDVGELDLADIHWVIVGGESGPKARPIKLEWVENIQQLCEEQGVQFFFKQWGGWGADGKRRSKKANGRMLAGRTWDDMPELSAHA